jgi:hypothetical protein
METFNSFLGFIVRTDSGNLRLSLWVARAPVVEYDFRRNRRIMVIISIIEFIFRVPCSCVLCFFDFEGVKAILIPLLK